MRRLMLAFAVLTMLPFAAFAQTVKCPNPAPYGLTNAEVNVSNAEFYCWEIKYMKERLGQLSMSESAYVALYPQPLFVSSAESLREAGITPEKAQYLQDYFLSDGEYSSSISDDRKLVSRLVSAAADVTRNRAEYKIDKFLGLWQVYHSILKFMVFPCVTVSGAISDSNPVVTLIARMLPLSHLIDLPYSDVAISEFVNVHPNKYARHALAPVGVISKSFINAFGEVVGEIKADKDFGFLLMSGASHPFYVNGSSTRAGLWDSATCNIKALGRRVKSSTSCLPCVIFEIVFNTVSRIGFVIWDRLAWYATEFMAVLFLLWMAYVFFDEVIRKQKPFEFVRTFFNRAMWVFIIAAFLAVSITSEFNIINYTFRPMTDFMKEFNELMTSGIEKGADVKPWECTFESRKEIRDSRVLFSQDVKMNIVCSIERMADFNSMNFMVGEYHLSLGWREFLDFQFGSGLVKMIIGFSIMAIFFYMNLTVPFYFIESLFMIALVLFVSPLLLAAYAFSKDMEKMVKKGISTFLAAIFQIISLTLMCSVISLLMMYVSGLDFYNLHEALQSGDSQQSTAEILYILSFSTNDLLQVLYTGLVCWYLMGKALTIANKYAGDGVDSGFKGELPKRFLDWTRNIIKYSTSVVREKVAMKSDAKVLRDKLLRNRKSKAREKNEAERVVGNAQQDGDTGDGS